MKIERKIGSMLIDINAGDCFKNDMGDIYMRTAEIDGDGEIQCVELESGWVRLFSLEAVAIPVNVKAVEE